MSKIVYVYLNGDYGDIGFCILTITLDTQQLHNLVERTIDELLVSGALLFPNGKQTQSVKTLSGDDIENVSSIMSRGHIMFVPNGEDFKPGVKGIFVIFLCLFLFFWNCIDIVFKFVVVFFCRLSLVGAVIFLFFRSQ